MSSSLLPSLPSLDGTCRSHGPGSQEPISGEPGPQGGEIFLVFINFLVLNLLRYATSA